MKMATLQHHFLNQKNKVLNTVLCLLQLPGGRTVEKCGYVYSLKEVNKHFLLGYYVGRVAKEWGGAGWFH